IPSASRSSNPCRPEPTTRSSTPRPVLRPTRPPAPLAPGPGAAQVDPAPSIRSPQHPRRNDCDDPPTRSEEHTSELQSLTNLVCRLLLEKTDKQDTLLSVLKANLKSGQYMIPRAAPVFLNDTATTEIYTLSLHDALPICECPGSNRAARTLAIWPVRRGRSRGLQ